MSGPNVPSVKFAEFLAEMEVLPWNVLCKGQDQILPDSRKKRKDSIPEATVQSVIEFYNRFNQVLAAHQLGITNRTLDVALAPKAATLCWYHR